jgi:hypothetical protein
MGDAAMYVVIRQTRLARAVEKVVERTRNYILPLVQGQPGFRGYCGFVPEAGDAAFSISIFDDRDAAMAAHHCVREWIDMNMRDLLPDDPEVVAGEAVFHEVSHPQDQQEHYQRSLFVVIRTYQGITGQTEAMHSTTSEHTLPAILRAPGSEGSTRSATRKTLTGPSR